MSHYIRKAATALESKLETKLDPKPAPAAPGRHESDLEHRTRKARNFEETEAKLPNLRNSPAPDDRPTIGTNILSYLGTWNPRPHPITSNDTVWLFDNTAYRNPTTNNWEAEVIAAVFDKETGVKVSLVVADIAEKLGLGHGDAAEARIKDRLMPFMQSVLPGRVVNVDFGRRTQLKFGPGGRNGISSDLRPLPHHQDGKIVSGVARVPKGTNGILQMKTVYAEPEGWGIISGMLRSLQATFRLLTKPQMLMIRSKSHKLVTRSVFCEAHLPPKQLLSQACPCCIAIFKPSRPSLRLGFIFLLRPTTYTHSSTSSFMKTTPRAPLFSAMLAGGT